MASELKNLTAYFQFLTIEAATATDGEYDIFDSVVHVTFFAPVNQMNGGLTINDFYDLEGTDHNGTEISFTGQQFQGFSSTNTARFAANAVEGVAIQIGKKGTVKRVTKKAEQ